MVDSNTSGLSTGEAAHEGLARTNTTSGNRKQTCLSRWCMKEVAPPEREVNGKLSRLNRSSSQATETVDHRTQHAVACGWCSNSRKRNPTPPGASNDCTVAVSNRNAPPTTVFSQPNGTCQFLQATEDSNEPRMLRIVYLGGSLA